MQITYKNFDKLKFPLFRVNSDNYHLQDGIFSIDNLVVDDRNMPGASLGIRRLQCKRLDLFPLKKCIFKPIDLIRSNKKFYIDNNGRLLTYTKTLNCKLSCYSIIKIDKKDKASLLWLKNINSPFTIDRPPIHNFSYVRLLHLGNNPWMIYDYVRFPVKDTYRKV